jgi:hypothetical protein
MRFIPSGAFLVIPIQFVKPPKLTFARNSFNMPLIMVAAFPTRNVWHTMAYGTNLCVVSTNLSKYWPFQFSWLANGSQGRSERLTFRRQDIDAVKKSGDVNYHVIYGRPQCLRVALEILSIGEVLK